MRENPELYRLYDKVPDEQLNDIRKAAQANAKKVREDWEKNIPVNEFDTMGSDSRIYRDYGKADPRYLEKMEEAFIS